MNNFLVPEKNHFYYLIGILVFLQNQSRLKPIVLCVAKLSFLSEKNLEIVFGSEVDLSLIQNYVQRIKSVRLR